jgi:hypothetical protein
MERRLHMGMGLAKHGVTKTAKKATSWSCIILLYDEIYTGKLRYYKYTHCIFFIWVIFEHIV